MPDSTASAGPNSTPAPGDPAASAAAAPASGVTAPASATEAQPGTPAASAAPASPPAAPGGETRPAAADPAAADPAKPPQDKPGDPPADPATETPPLFKLPEDMKLAPEALQKFEGAVKEKLADGKITLTAQELVDLYADQARDAFGRWQKQVADQDKAWEAESKQRFNEAQLAAAETGIGFLSSFDPQFREVAKSFRNHPVFVNAMRIVGERLSEDTFEIAGTHREEPQRRPADILYPKK